MFNAPVGEKASIHIAEEYINGLTIVIEPRKMFMLSDVTSSKRIATPNKEGICLSKYGDPGYGELIKRDKYSGQNCFCDELVGKSANVLRPFVEEKGILHITCVPSLRSNIVADFSKKLADSLGIQFVELLEKSATRQQKDMQNSSHQCGTKVKRYKWSLIFVVRELIHDPIYRQKGAYGRQQNKRPEKENRPKLYGFFKGIAFADTIF